MPRLPIDDKLLSDAVTAYLSLDLVNVHPSVINAYFSPWGLDKVEPVQSDQSMFYKIETSATGTEFVVFYSFDAIRFLGLSDDNADNEYAIFGEPRFLINHGEQTVGHWFVGAFEGRIKKSYFDFFGLDYSILGSEKLNNDSGESAQLFSPVVVQPKSDQKLRVYDNSLEIFEPLPPLNFDALQVVLDQFVHWFLACPYNRSTNAKKRVFDDAVSSISNEFNLTPPQSKNYFWGVRQRLDLLP